MSDFIPGKEDDELTLVIEDREIIISSGKLLKTMDTGSDAFTCVMPWEPELDSEIDQITAPYSYSECRIYIAGDLFMSGILYTVTPEQTNTGTTRKLEIYSKIADMIDSSWRPPYEENNIDLQQICASQASAFGIEVVLDSGVNVGGKFSRISVKQTDKCFDKLSKLAAQRGLLLSCNKYSELLIIKPNLNGTPVGTLFPENAYTQSYSAKFDGRKRFYQYEALGASSSSERTTTKQIARDTTIPASRFLTFKADESLPGETLNAAEWRRNKIAADSMMISWPINTWYNPKNELWQVNTKVTVKNPIISISEGFTFLINQVEYNFENSGTTARLNLVPPSMYGQEDIEEPQWD